MTKKEQRQSAATGSSERDRRSSGDEPERGKRGRWSARRKQEAVLRLLRGEDLDLLSRELGVTAARLSQWRDDFLEGGLAQLKARPSLDRDREIAQLQRKVGELLMETELLREKARRLEERAPDFPWRRSKK